MKVLNFGSLNLDHVYRVDHFVQPGETLGAIEQSVNPGGKGLNQSIALARAGAEVFHAGCIGKGGEALAALLSENGVNTDFLVKVDQIQGNAVIQVDRSGQNCILLFGGSNRCITEDQIESTLEHFSAGDFLVLQNEVNLLKTIIDRAFRKGMKIFLNPSPFDDSIKETDLNKISWLLVNEVEVKQLSGSDDPSKAWSYIHEKHPELSLLVTLGGEGSAAFTKTEAARVKATKVVPVDTTAAGDTYTGYFIAGLMKGLPLKQCMQNASRAAGISVTRHGAAPSIPYLYELGK